MRFGAGRISQMCGFWGTFVFESPDGGSDAYNQVPHGWGNVI
jgi:hypothetical protein